MPSTASTWFVSKCQDFRMDTLPIFFDNEIARHAKAYVSYLSGMPDSEEYVIEIPHR